VGAAAAARVGQAGVTARAGGLARARAPRRQWALLLPLLVSHVPWVSGCAAGAPATRPSGEPHATPGAPALAFRDDDHAAPLTRYHSKRLALSVALPDGRQWRIDDHSRAELVATHAPTRSRVTVAVFHTDEVVGRAQCEALARSHDLVPAGELLSLEDAAIVTQRAFDTRVWVAVSPGVGPGGVLAGHVMAFGGFLRKCFAFVFSTEVAGAADEAVLSSRLAFARARILGALALDAFDTIPRDAR
jgi:hypothetical protein